MRRVRLLKPRIVSCTCAARVGVVNISEELRAVEPIKRIHFTAADAAFAAGAQQSCTYLQRKLCPLTSKSVLKNWPYWYTYCIRVVRVVGTGTQVVKRFTYTAVGTPPYSYTRLPDTRRELCALVNKMEPPTGKAVARSHIASQALVEEILVNWLTFGVDLGLELRLEL